MTQSVADLLPWLRELAFGFGFVGGAIAGLIGGVFWRLQ